MRKFVRNRRPINNNKPCISYRQTITKIMNHFTNKHEQTKTKYPTIYKETTACCILHNNGVNIDINHHNQTDVRKSNPKCFPSPHKTLLRPPF